MSDLAARVAALEAEVQRLRDRAELEELRFRYHVAVNEKRPAEIAPLFAREGSLDFGPLGRAVGRAEIAAFFEANLADPAAFVKQFIHDPIVDLVAANHARGLSYLEARTVFDGEAYMVAARYDDEYTREREGWRFRKMTMTLIYAVPLHEGWAQEPRVRLGPR
jgi:hypothetical protein